MKYQIQRVETNSDWKDFLDLPYNVYLKDPIWVPPLRSEVRKVLNQHTNPYFFRSEVQLFLCYRSGRPVARLAVIINHQHWQRWNQKSAFFGFFESLNDYAATEYLFEEAEKYAREKGATLLEGPFNPNHYSEIGLLVKNFTDAPFFFETYNPDYYPVLLERAGFRIQFKVHTRINRNATAFVKQIHPESSLLPHQTEFTIRPFRLWQMKKDLERIREVNNEAFKKNWPFIPLNAAEYRYTSKQLFFVTQPKLVLIVERGQEPVGVIQCMLNINKILRTLNGKLSVWDYLKFPWKRNQIREIVIYSIGIKSKYRHSYAFKLIWEAVKQIAKKYPVISTSWMRDDNIQAVKATDLLGLKPYKWFALYNKWL